MKRSSFLKFGVAISALFTAPGAIFARSGNSRQKKPAFKVDAGKDRFGKSTALFDGDTFFTKVSGKDTDGDMFIFDSIRTKEGGPILHTHYEQDEWWYILEGSFLVRLGDKTYEGKPGDFFFGPRGVPHTFAKVGEGAGRVIIGFQPAGKMEDYFAKLAEGVAKNMTEAERDDLRKAHGFERVGPPIKVLKQ